MAKSKAKRKQPAKKQPTTKLYTFCIFEHRLVEMTYVVEADDYDEAREKAEAGDTVSEEFVKDLEISDREIYQLKKVEEQEDE